LCLTLLYCVGLAMMKMQNNDDSRVLQEYNIEKSVIL
jgi:hypothetical protein